MQSPDRLAVTGPAADPSYLLHGNTPTRMMHTMDQHYAAAARTSGHRMQAREPPGDQPTQSCLIIM
jgi:hypothetical protein